MAEIQAGYSDLKKGLDNRVKTETAKAKELKEALIKIKASLEIERKTYCVDLKKSLMTYSNQNPIEQIKFKLCVDEFQNKLEELDKVYEKTIKHIETVAIGAMNTLPTKYEGYKAAIKKSDKQPAELAKIKDFEYDRLEYTKLAMLHFINAKMHLHSRALEIFAQAYHELDQINYAQEFKGYEKTQLKAVFADLGLVTTSIQTSGRSSGGNPNKRSI